MATVVLIVSKDKESAEHCSEGLNLRGYNTVIAHSAESALSLLRTASPDVLLLDAVMALDHEEPDLPAAIVSDSELHAIPIVLTVGLAHPPTFPFEQNAREEGLRVIETVSVAAPPPALAGAVERARRAATHPA